ncbi:MAG TPA: helix-turn-helix domain-containing protein, partial [Verrucomicrobiae bacterium]
LSTYGIGKEVGRAEWSAIGRELIRLGLATQDADKFNVLGLTPEGRATLTQRKPVRLTKAMKVPERRAHAVGEIACDEALFEVLRALRKKLADERGVPPYIVFSDVSLRQMARLYPVSTGEFARISGVGQVKLRDFGAVFMNEIVDFLGTHPKQIFADESFLAPLPSRARLNDTTRETLRNFLSGDSVEQIAQRRQLAVSTIYGHLAAAVDAGEKVDLNQLLTPGEQETVRSAFAKAGFGNLAGVHESLGGKFDYGLLRVCRALQQRRA